MFGVVFVIVIPLIRGLVHLIVADVPSELRAMLKARGNLSLGSASLPVEFVLRVCLHFDQVRYLAGVVRRSPTLRVERTSEVLSGLVATVLLLTESYQRIDRACVERYAELTARIGSG